MSLFEICFFLITLYFEVNHLHVWCQTAERDAGGKKQVCQPWEQCAVFNDRLAQQQLPRGTSLALTVSALKICIGREGGVRKKEKKKKQDLCLCHGAERSVCSLPVEVTLAAGGRPARLPPPPEGQREPLCTQRPPRGFASGTQSRSRPEKVK